MTPYEYGHAVFVEKKAKTKIIKIVFSNKLVFLWGWKRKPEGTNEFTDEEAFPAFEDGTVENLETK